MTFKNTCSMVCFALAGILVLSCGGEPDSAKSAPADDPVALALAVAQEYVDGYYHQFPEEAYEFGYRKGYDRGRAAYRRPSGRRYGPRYGSSCGPVHGGWSHRRRWW